MQPGDTIICAHGHSSFLRYSVHVPTVQGREDTEEGVQEEG